MVKRGKPGPHPDPRPGGRFRLHVEELERRLAPATLVDPLTVTYQDACHLAHAQHITQAPRRLLSRIPGLHLREMNESSLCCGSAGVYNITQPEMAARLGERKARNVADARANFVATGNPGCALQMRAHLRKIGDETIVKHVIELLDESYSNYMDATNRSRSLSAASSEP